MGNAFTTDPAGTCEAAAPMSWDDPDWPGLSPAPRGELNRSKLDAAEVADLLARTRDRVADDVAHNRSTIVDGVPEALPDVADVAAWRELAVQWSARTDARSLVWVAWVPMQRRDSLVHVHTACPVLTKSGRRPRTWAGVIAAFTENRICTKCFGAAPRDVSEVFAFGVAARHLRRLSPLRMVASRMPRHGHGRAQCTESITRLTDAAAIVADYDPRVAEICAQAAAAARHAYDAAAAHLRATGHVSAAMFLDHDRADDLDASTGVEVGEVLEKLAGVPATVRLSGAAWVGDRGYRIADTGAMFDLGKNRLVWETTTCSALFLLISARNQGRSAKISVESSDPTFALALQLAGDDPRRVLSQWETAEAVLA